MVFVPHHLAYFTQHNALQLHPCCHKRYKKNLCTPMFIAAQFTIAKYWKQPKCPSTNEWIEKKRKTNSYGMFTQWNSMQQRERRSLYSQALELYSFDFVIQHLLFFYFFLLTPFLCPSHKHWCSSQVQPMSSSCLNYNPFSYPLLRSSLPFRPRILKWCSVKISLQESSGFLF